MNKVYSFLSLVYLSALHALISSLCNFGWCWTNSVVVLGVGAGQTRDGLQHARGGGAAAGPRAGHAAARAHRAARRAHGRGLAQVRTSIHSLIYTQYTLTFRNSQ